MYALGQCYYEGEGVEKDTAEAVNWLRKAAEHDNTKAMIDLAFCYEQGIGIRKDEAEASKWRKKAAEIHTKSEDNK